MKSENQNTGLSQFIATEYKNLEANILRGMADDVTVSARPSRAELTVIKLLPAKQ